MAVPLVPRPLRALAGALVGGISGASFGSIASLLIGAGIGAVVGWFAPVR